MIHETVHRRQISENRKTASVNKKELSEKFSSSFPVLTISLTLICFHKCRLKGNVLT